VNPTLLIVIPTYGQFEYAIDAIRSAVESTTLFAPSVVVIDDASPDWDTSSARQQMHMYIDGVNALHPCRIQVVQHIENKGLTYRWNEGLQLAKFFGFDACCVTNSDVVFAKDWDYAIFNALNFKDYALVGPLTNAPGTNLEQYIGRYSIRYDKATARDNIDYVQQELINVHSSRVKDTTLNGFCMTAFTKTWWENAFDSDSKGEKNPTPLMTLNEYELQARWHAKGLQTAVCLGSYVFHYRAVSRGDKHKRGDWVRKTEGQS
jgi:glycosyltransferase involved in cell wall biosynthesis